MAEWYRLSGLSRAIKSGKEHRKEYRGAKAIDCSCRNHGTCEWCKANRLYASNREKEAAQQKYEEYFNSWVQTLLREEEEDIEIEPNIVVEDVSFNGEPLDGHMLERMIEEMEE